MPKDMSFLPEDYLEKRVARRTNVICISLFVIVTAAIVATFFITDKQVDDLQKQQLSVNHRYEEAAANLEKLEQLQNQKLEMIHKAEVTCVLVERVPRSRLLAEMTNHMPLSMNLLEFKLETKEEQNSRRARTSLERAKQTQNNKKDAEKQLIVVPEKITTIQVVGLAPTDVEVAQFLTALSAHPLFISPLLQFSEETEVVDRKMRRFRITMKLNQKVKMQDVAPKLVRRELKNNPMDSDMVITEEGPKVTSHQVMPTSYKAFNRNGGQQ
ncbi:PilN domain-containing protein [Planctomycetota bacterium]|nr:PilN domain-containing protein [Planctomycetota bacterium]